MKSSRRTFLKSAATLPSITLPGIIHGENPEKKLKIVCVGGHPDDPESGCGGTMALASGAGHSVTTLYLTRGEAGIQGKSHTEAAAIRTKEAEQACTILKTKPVFAGQVDGATLINRDWIVRFQQLLESEKPDVVFTQWPIDSHPDHQMASLLTINAWIRTTKKFSLYFYEVCTGEQTLNFRPTDYVDITSVQEIKKKAVYCHVSQSPEAIYACGHSAMEHFRGLEAGTKAAEAFISAAGNGLGELLGATA